jgi:hypothetical protein
MDHKMLQDLPDIQGSIRLFPGLIFRVNLLWQIPASLHNFFSLFI